jgi:hypothetical protein
LIKLNHPSQLKRLKVVQFLQLLNVLTDAQSVEKQGLNMRASRGMGAINPSKMPDKKVIKRKDNPNDVDMYAEGGKVSKVNQAGNYTQPGKRKAMFESIKNSAVQGTAAGQWSARKAQLLAKRYKASGGGYK